jgi:hypothetical protein
LRYGIILAMYPDGDSTVRNALDATGLSDFDGMTPGNLIDLRRVQAVQHGEIRWAGRTP